MICFSNLALPEEKPKEEDPEDDKSVTPDGRKDEPPHPTPQKAGKAKTEKSDSKKEKRKTSAKGSRTARRSSAHGAASPPPGAPTPQSDADGR
jgi:hypothetical protein